MQTMSQTTQQNDPSLHSRLKAELNQLRRRRLGCFRMQVAITHPSDNIELKFKDANVCAAVADLKYTGAHLYIRPKIPTFKNCATEDEAMLREIRKAAVLEGDILHSHGVGQKKINKNKDPVALIIRCQCSRHYGGNKVNRNTGEVQIRKDYRVGSYRNDRKNNRPGVAGRKGSQRTLTQNPDPSQ